MAFYDENFGPYAPAAPSVTEGFMVKPEVRVLVGTAYMFGSLDMSSYAYDFHTIPVGLDTTNNFELGALASIGATLALNWEPVDTANLPTGRLYDLTSEEITIPIEVKELKPELLELILHTTAYTEHTDQRLYAIGGGCSLVSRPVSIEWTNVSCDAPTSEDIATGISGGVLTIFDAICTSGLDWGSMVRNDQNSITVSLSARPVLDFAAGQRLASLWLY